MWSPDRQAGETKIIGPAYTVKYVRKDEGKESEFRGHYVSLFFYPYSFIYRLFQIFNIVCMYACVDGMSPHHHQTSRCMHISSTRRQNLPIPFLSIQIDSIPPNSIIFISSPPKIVNAVYGGLMSTRAKHSGALGTIVDGRVRDLQEHRDLNYPVFARDTGTASPQEVLRVSEVICFIQIFFRKLVFDTERFSRSPSQSGSNPRKTKTP